MPFDYHFLESNLVLPAPNTLRHTTGLKGFPFILKYYEFLNILCLPPPYSYEIFSMSFHPNHLNLSLLQGNALFSISLFVFLYLLCYLFLELR